MAGRPSKPTQLIKLEGNKDRRTKAELEHREKVEKSLQTGTSFREEATTKADPVAHKEFLRLRKLFKGIEFVEGLDQATINRYCQLKSTEQMLQELYIEVNEKMQSYKQVSKRLSLYDDLKDIISKQNQVRDKMLKLEDRLFLNPVARMRSIPKDPDKGKPASPMQKFLDKKRNGT
ncbi:P27 family phage terminase small subunit [Paenalkalicoccus suaedae]|uniref:P27 family phage terminase small subunit n=1 Tax=Paenalkalicoccus suaedae TaxID=2592382 RepID=A0A859FI88_9BACI|nr:P27 family phage terminase small subunit [Paenalkalicoccus suaedae]QKS71916.1 P27 family phage terminase small subunit [Paenalkalicoccus suaedae]